MFKMLNIACSWIGRMTFWFIKINVTVTSERVNCNNEGVINATRSQCQK